MINILVIRVSAIGDVIHTLPAIFLIKQMIPDARIHWIVQQKAASLLLNQPLVDTVWILPDNYISFKHRKKTLDTITQLKKITWTAILDFQGIPKTSCLVFPLSGKKYGFSYRHARMGITSWLTDIHDTPTYTNIIQKNLSLASTMLADRFNIQHNLSLDTLQKAFKLSVPEQAQIIVDNWITQITHNQKLILLAPNTTRQSKHWPLEHWKILIKELLMKHQANGIRLALIGQNFGDQAQALAQFITQKKLGVLMVPDWNLLSLSHLTRQSQLLIAPDTGLLHLADFLNTPALGLFGPTSKDSHGPFLRTKNRQLALQAPCLNTEGSFLTKNQKARLNQDCMSKLLPSLVMQHIAQLLK